MVVLIDFGASHNFIPTDLVAKAGIHCIGTSSFRVLMGLCPLVKGEGICKGVVLQLQNIRVVQDILPLKLGSADVIVGTQ